MSRQSPEGFTKPEQPGQASLGPIGIDYIPTEEEKRVFRECNQESFWYRSVPISVIGMALTQFLISRGALTASGRFGSLPKVGFAGVCGYLGGKMSYMKTCQEKFKSLENSPLGEVLRERQRHQPPMFTHEKSELSDPNKADFEPAFQLDDQKAQSFSLTRDFTYGDPIASPSQYDTQLLAEPSYIEEDAQKKPLLYEEPQSKNGENYEVTKTPKADTQLKPQTVIAPTNRGKKNIYGDTWEE
ncbi:OCIA domain-containing protein 1-like isoform X1 [Myxocyprinus asiaticus]|uniref:OCIA domain-containing protein 1-like isoform X1 n=1 Tax=Myxocyprinus asiaticus TaxID=70543 RepID=UPI002222CC73|nr:OCIA domain-containing protein 1-like isoform X1 [Myxocyprinus asiaticus]